MKVIEARNVHSALPTGLRHLLVQGVRRQSRNGDVIQAPTPVTTVYQQPTERVLFWPERDANVAFHLAEALWMLAGRNDLAFLTRYIKDFGQFSDDGTTLHGAYGYRWRQYGRGWDQLRLIAHALRQNPHDRRCVLQMWEAGQDLGRSGKDLPCNLTATFQINLDGALDLTVFCRSNDAILGAYGANAVHFSLLLEYMAGWIGCAVGRYYQVSVNFHAYVERFEQLKPLVHRTAAPMGVFLLSNPYTDDHVMTAPLWRTGEWRDGDSIESLDEEIRRTLARVDSDFTLPRHRSSLFFETADAVLYAFHLWRTLAAPERYTRALEVLAASPQQDVDWLVAMRQWLARRYTSWLERMESRADPQQA